MTWLAEIGDARTRGVRPRARVVAVPHAGGWPSAFRPWRPELPADVELLVAQLPGRGARGGEPVVDRVAPLVAGLAGAIGELEPLPYAVVGHSFGSVIGYELTKEMEARGFPPELLVVSGRQAPCLPSEPPFLHQGSDDELLAHLGRIGGIPAELAERADFVAAALRTIRADLAALETYRRPLAGTRVPMIALGAPDDPIVMHERMNLWSLETTGGFTFGSLSGGHFFLYQQENARTVARDVLDALESGCRRNDLVSDIWDIPLTSSRRPFAVAASSERDLL
ncbi:thioesterase II family protein [Actinokineospora guangxiensis]|uniref:Thioesterase II family protein n=1 Tax=Actinokineospora guangxiensis TaxID=1490288 RepID=A0ABW0EPG3_9PSEU